MSGNVNIKRGDLHLAVSAAFTRGRYVLMTGGEGDLREITIDLRERPDDLFGAEPEASTDDHGPAVPSQGQPGPLVYEFALQDIGFTHFDLIGVEDAPNRDAAETADWVHVFDRVTRERRTLKRPAPDAILTGLQDVAADLRRGVAERALFERKIETAFPSGEPVFGLVDALPPGGPLTSTEGLRVGDMVRVEYVAPEWNGVWPVTDPEPDQNGGLPGVSIHHARRGEGRFRLNDGLSFVGRPDADGWMTWAGGDNPVPGARVEYKMRGGSGATDSADCLIWGHSMALPDCEIVAFRIVDSLNPV